MFILYALPLGLIAGLMSGGRIAGLSDVRLRWAPLALVGLLVQVVLFLGPVAEAVGKLGMPIYVGSTALVLVVVVRNAARPGLAVIALGALSNLVAIAANGGYMPASPAAMAALGRTVHEGYSNSAVMPEPMLWPLTDIFAIPAGVPFANVFSVGDLLIGLGVGWAIAAAMHLRPAGDPTVEGARQAKDDLDGDTSLVHLRRAMTPVPASVFAGTTLAATAGGPMMVAGPPPAEPASPPASTAVRPRSRVGRVTEVAVTQAWGSDLDLATWLAENVDLVGTAAGLSLSGGQVMESERPVVLAEHDGRSVVIVSDRGPATDDAFGCLVRHVAACQADLGIWICSEVADQHAATVAWLNVATGITFAMLQLSAVRIGDSPPAALLGLTVRAPRRDDPRSSLREDGRVAGAGRRAGDWLRPA